MNEQDNIIQANISNIVESNDNINAETEQIPTEESTKRKNPLEASFSALAEVAPELTGKEGVEAIASILALPEDQFEVLCPILEIELEKSLNNTMDKLLLVQALNAQGYKSEELKEAFEVIAEQIDTQMAADLSQKKRDFLKHLMASI